MVLLSSRSIKYQSMDMVAFSMLQLLYRVPLNHSPISYTFHSENAYTLEKDVLVPHPEEWFPPPEEKL